jgi:hypothetical protein
MAHYTRGDKMSESGLRILQRINDLYIHVGDSKRAGAGGSASAHLVVDKWPAYTDPYTLVKVPSGCCVVDIDDERHIEALRLRSDTLMVKTPNGWHYWYAIPPGIQLPGVIGLMGDTPSLVADEATYSRTAHRRSVDFIVGGHSAWAVIPPTTGYSLRNDSELALLPPTVVSAVYMTVLNFNTSTSISIP